MRRTLLLFLFTSALFGAWDKGFNFRSTAGYVTDGAGETYVLVEAYPTTRNGVTFGWESTSDIGSHDSHAGIDRRLAGVHYVGNWKGPLTFRVDLPAPGTYNIRLAAGTMALGDISNNVTFYDDSVSLGTSNASPPFQSYQDALAAVHTFTNWPGSNSPATLTFSSSILKVTIAGGAAYYRAMAHIFISQQGASRSRSIIVGGNSTPHSLFGLLVSSGENSIAGGATRRLTLTGTYTVIQ